MREIKGIKMKITDNSQSMNMKLDSLGILKPYHGTAEEYYAEYVLKLLLKQASINKKIEKTYGKKVISTVHDILDMPLEEFEDGELVNEINLRDFIVKETSKEFIDKFESELSNFNISKACKIEI